MNWQRPARALLAIGGLGCAASVYFMLGKRPPPPAAVAPPVHDPQATNETGPGYWVEHLADGRESWRINFQSSSSYADGHMRFDRTVFVTARGSQPLKILSDQAEYRKSATPGGTGDVTLNGHVVLETADRWHLETPMATYVDASSTVLMPQQVTFVRDRLAGSSHGATYDRAKQNLDLLDQPHITMRPDETNANALDAVARRISILHDENYARLDDHARLVRDKETMTADLAILRLNEDQKGIRAIELTGHASVVPEPGAVSPPPTMRGDAITLAIAAAGQTVQSGTLRGAAVLTTGDRNISARAIDFRLAPDGQTLTALDASDQVDVTLPPTADTPSRRRVLAQTLKATGSDKAGLELARFDGGAATVVFTETSPAANGKAESVRTGVSRVLTMKLNGDLGAVDSAVFLHEVKFTDGPLIGMADRGDYVEAKGVVGPKLALFPADQKGGPLPRATTDDIEITADVIRVDLDSEDVAATGHVQTIKQPASGPRAAKPPATANPGAGRGANAAGGVKPGTGVFNSTQRVFGQGTDVTYSRDRNLVTYKGNTAERALVYQEDNKDSVKADYIEVNQQTQDLKARGHVESRFTSDPAAQPAGRRGGPPPAPGVTNTVRAAAMSYTDANHKALYTGETVQRVRLEGPDGITDAATIEVTLDEDGRTVKRMVADGDVDTIQKVVGRRAAGAHLTYDADADRYVLTGSPALVLDPKKDPKPGELDCLLTRYAVVNFTSGPGISSGVSVNGAKVEDRDWKCSDGIPKDRK